MDHSAKSQNTISRDERLKSKKVIEQLFKGGKSNSISGFPLRAVYTLTPMTDPNAQAKRPPIKIMVSVSKRKIRKAVDRNRIKRLIREAYRTHKHILYNTVSSQKQLNIAWIWTHEKEENLHVIEKKLTDILHKIAENTCKMTNEKSAQAFQDT